MSAPRPLAVAVIRHRPAATRDAQRRARRAVTTHADTEGYAVTELFEAFGRADLDEATLDLLVDLARRVEARAVLTLGDIDTQTLAQIACRCELTVLQVPEAAWAGTRFAAVCPIEEMRSAWTGRLDFDLKNGCGWRVATIEVVVRIESVTLWFANRTLAVMDRDLFRAWLANPDRIFSIDDVTWSASDAGLCITVDGSISYAVPDPTVRQLVAVI